MIPQLYTSFHYIQLVFPVTLITLKFVKNNVNSLYCYLEGTQTPHDCDSSISKLWLII